jgi:hypothetical protein
MLIRCFEASKWDILSSEAIVTTLQRQRVIPDQASHVDLLVQVTIPLIVPVQAELVGFANIDIHVQCHYGDPFIIGMSIPQHALARRAL